MHGQQAKDMHINNIDQCFANQKVSRIRQFAKGLNHSQEPYRKIKKDWDIVQKITNKATHHQVKQQLTKHSETRYSRALKGRKHGEH